MWAYGLHKKDLPEILKVPLDKRKPSEGLRLLDVKMPDVGFGEVLVKIKASALNYNSIWSSLVHPIDPFRLIEGFVKRNPIKTKHLQDFAIFGSDAAGSIAKVGPGVNTWKEGDEVVIHCNIVDNSQPISQQDAMLSPSQAIWGYETNFGAFAEYTVVDAGQALPKPKGLTFEEAASLMLTLSTSYRMLISKNGAQILPGETVLIWGATGGLGVYAIQLAKMAGAKVCAVVNSKKKSKRARELGADFVIDRSEGIFNDLLDRSGNPNLIQWGLAKRTLKKMGIPEIDVVFEHVGRQTLGFSIYLLKRGGRVVTCAASSGYNAVIDLRYLWMELKSLIGSHFANNHEANQALKLVDSGTIKPVVDSVNPMMLIGEKLDSMYRGENIGKIVLNNEDI